MALQIEKTLTTQRLTLSPVIWADAFFFARLIGNSDVRKFLGGPVPPSQRFARFRAYHRGHPKLGIWVVRETAQRIRLGVVELTPHKDGADYEVSYQFHPTSWGKGYAREAVAAVTRHALTDLGFTRVIAETQTANTRSCHLLESLGFDEIDRITRFGALQAIYATSQPAPGP